MGERTTTLPARPQWTAEAAATAWEQRQQASMTVGSGVVHTFSRSELDLSGQGGTQLVAVSLVGLEQTGSITLSGEPVMLNDVIPVDALDAGELQYQSGTGEVGLDHDRFLFAVHDGTDWTLPIRMLVHTVVPDRLVAAATGVELPTAQDGTVTTAEDAKYVFKPSDFNFQGAEADFKAVQIVTVDTVGKVLLHGEPVTLGQVIEVSDIDLELVAFEPTDPGKEGFEFKVHDGEHWSDETYTMLVEVTSHYLPPTASDCEVRATMGEPRVITAADFRYNSFGAGDELQRVRVGRLSELKGAFVLQGKPVQHKQIIPREALDAGHLVYHPKAIGASDSLWFRVHDGTAYSVPAYQMRFVVAEPAAQSKPQPKSEPDQPVYDAPANDAGPVDLTESETKALARRPVMKPRHFDLSVQAPGSTAYVFTVRDLMPDNNSFSELLITTVDIVGLLQLDGMAVTGEQRITRQMVDEGRLTFLPAGSGKQKYFDFRMRRGLKWSPSTCSMWIEIVQG